MLRTKLHANFVTALLLYLLEEGWDGSLRAEWSINPRNYPGWISTFLVGLGEPETVNRFMVADLHPSLPPKREGAKPETLIKQTCRRFPVASAPAVPATARLPAKSPPAG